jgi:phosphoribosylformylglycinamidine synthase
MTDTVLLPGGDSAIIRVHGTNKGLSVTSDSTPRYCASDPFEGGKQAVAEAWRNLISVGSTPIAITDCMNFGNPEKKEIMGQFAGVIKGMIEACNTLDFPVVSGNVSLYNETNGKGINPTPVIGGVGVVNNLDIFSDQNFKRINDLILVIGKTNGHLTQSIYANELLNYKKGLPPKVDLEEELKNGLALKELITKRLIDTSHDISDGGLLVALTEMSMKNNIGYKVNITKENLNSYLFGEDQARYAVAIEKSKIEEVRSFLIDKNIFFEEIGQTNKDNIIFNDEKISVTELRDIYENWFNNYLSEAS